MPIKHHPALCDLTDEYQRAAQKPGQGQWPSSGTPHDIKAWIAIWNDNPRPFTWTKPADEILASLADYLTKLRPSQALNEQG